LDALLKQPCDLRRHCHLLQPLSPREVRTSLTILQQHGLVVQTTETYAIFMPQLPVRRPAAPTRVQGHGLSS
jgi:hypothetical protein